MVAMMTKPKSQARKGELRKKAVAKVLGGDPRSYEVTKNDQTLNSQFKVQLSKFLSQHPLPDYGEVYQVPEPHIVKSNVVPFPNSPPEDAVANTLKDDSVAYEAWLEAFTTFFDHARLYRVEKKYNRSEDGTLRVRKVQVNKQFATFLKPGDFWGSVHPDGTERFDGEYPTRDEHIFESGKSKYHRFKTQPNLSLVKPKPWDSSMSTQKPVEGFESWSRPPTYGDIFVQLRKDVETYSYIKPVAWNLKHLRKTVLWNQLDASMWGPTPTERLEPFVRQVKQENTMARQYRLDPEACVLYDEQVKVFESLNAVNDQDYSGYGRIVSVDKIDLEGYNSVRSLLNRIPGREWSEVASSEVMLLPKPSSAALLDNEMGALKRIYFKSQMTKLDNWLCYRQEENEKVGRYYDWLFENEWLEKARLARSDQAFSQIRNCVHRNFYAPNHENDEVRWYLWWKAVATTEGFCPTSGVVKQPRPYIILDADSFKPMGAIEHWRMQVKSGKAPRKALINTLKGVVKYRAKLAERAKVSTESVPVCKPVESDSRESRLYREMPGLVEHVETARRDHLDDTRSVDVTEKIEPPVVVSPKYSPEDVYEDVKENLVRDGRHTSITRLVSDPKWEKANSLNKLLRIYQHESHDQVTIGLMDGYLDPESLVSEFGKDKHSGLLLPWKYFGAEEAIISPEEFARDVGVSSPRKTILDKARTMVEILAGKH